MGYDDDHNAPRWSLAGRFGWFAGGFGERRRLNSGGFDRLNQRRWFRQAQPTAVVSTGSTSGSVVSVTDAARG
jgi:hypothetical protein